MNPARLPIRSLATLLVAASALAQEASAPTTPAPVTPTPVRKPRTSRPEQAPYNLNVLFLDPAHGGDDSGARLGPNSLEKDVTLAFAERLRTLLAADAFMLVTTRTPNPDPGDASSTPPAVPTLDQRVELANRSRALACLVIHATSAGHGLHLFTSSLPALASSTVEVSGPHPIVPWNTAQAASLQGSQQLAADLAEAIDGIRIPLVAGHVSVKPLDSLTCPAILVELAPLASQTAGLTQTPASDPAYQQRVAQALASGLHAWRAQAQAQIDTEAQLQAQRQAESQASPAAQPKPAVPKSRPKPIRIPEEIPEVLPPAPVLPPRPPAPIVRRSPQPGPAPVPPPALPSASPPGARL